MISVLIRKRTQRHTLREASHEKTGAEIRAMYLQPRDTEDFLEPLDAGREAWGGFSLRASAEETTTVNNLISDCCPPPAPRTIKECNYVVLNHPVCVSLLWPPQYSSRIVVTSCSPT